MSNAMQRHAIEILGYRKLIDQNARTIPADYAEHLRDLQQARLFHQQFQRTEVTNARGHFARQRADM